MQSQIRIHFEDNHGKGLQPVLKVKLVDSDDTKDDLLKAFFQQLGGKSSWLAVRFDHSLGDPISGTTNYITISPIKPSELEETSRIIAARLGDDNVSGRPDNYSPFRPQKSETIISGNSSGHTSS